MLLIKGWAVLARKGGDAASMRSSTDERQDALGLGAGVAHTGLRHGLGASESRTKQQLIDRLDTPALFSTEALTTQPDAIDADQACALPVGQGKGWDVLGHTAHTADHATITDATKLMHSHMPG